MAGEDLGLAEAIAAIRAELISAQRSGEESDLRFGVKAVEVELVVDVERSAGGEASIKVLSLLSLGAKGGVSRGETHRVKVVLSPHGVGGAEFEVSALRKDRPDGVRPGG